MEGESKVITVVCTGNVCRSPMAERLLQSALLAQPSPWNSIKVISAGVSAFPGDPASRNAVEAMRRVKMDISDHRSRPLSDQLIDISDLILTMTTGHMEMIRLQNPDLTAPIFLFREWTSSGSKEVPDPFGGPLEVYLETRDNLSESIPSILGFLKTHFKA
ncbi:MAG TPA: low molecular weight protein arginine phosphatase [Oceanipulchritudo sp.]|nr:low molecular weight protein arginine phosphatase [Oceanipulchritudo sp.]